MAHIVDLQSFSDKRGTLTVIEKVLPFDIKRVYFINNPKEGRGSHGHKKNIQAMVAVRGSLKVVVENAQKVSTFWLDKPEICLILQPNDWHEMTDFDSDCTILVLASENYDPNDYVRKTIG